MARYQRNPLTAGRIIDGLAFVVTPGDNKLHTLNETATFLWQRASGPISLEQAAEALSAEYEVTPEQARLDTEACLRDLVVRGICIELPEPSP